MVARVSVVIPVFQNRNTIESVVKGVSDALSLHSNLIRCDFVLVNDGSTDGSWDVMEQLQRQDPARITLINLTRTFGQIPALLAGYSHAEGDCVVSMAADLQDPPEVVWPLVDAWLGGQKLVVASRAARNDGWMNNTIAKLGWALLRRYAVPNIPEGGFDFFLMDREICNYYVQDPEQNIFLQGRLLFYGAAPVLVPYERKRRHEGKSQTTMATKVKLFIDGFVAYSFLPLRILSLMGILLFFVAVVLSCVIAWYVLVKGSNVEGWASLVILILFLFGMQFLAIGVIGEYLWRAIEQVRRRPHYLIKSILPRQNSPA
jgi:dolichol-phosphate mannosyltransferase